MFNIQLDNRFTYNLEEFKEDKRQALAEIRKAVPWINEVALQIDETALQTSKNNNTIRYY